MKHLIQTFFLTLVLFSSLDSCREKTTYLSTLEDPETFHKSMKILTDVIVYDIFSPPVAARIYAYPSIAAFEAVRPMYDSAYQSLGGQLNELENIPQPSNEHINYHLASLHAFLKVAKALIFSEAVIQEYQKNLYIQLEKEGLPGRVKTASLAYGNAVADHLLNWADQDNYKQSRTFPQYMIRDDPEYWKPTPPDYMQGIEPHWNKIRTMALDSAGQFKPKAPEDFDLDAESEFYKQLLEVYEVGKNLNDEQAAIAKFWDCNPYVSHHIGHVMYATKKITPGGHWIGITAIATRKANSTFPETINAYANVSIALFDAFISCWDEKWRSILVRPETLINEYIDEEWIPLLQTPPFPEYTSGHSVISRAAAVTLTAIYGESFPYEDTVEVEYGLPVRAYDSFLAASEEAAISRLYGGIHYRMACVNGVEQGNDIGEFFVNKIRTRKERKSANLAFAE